MVDVRVEVCGDGEVGENIEVEESEEGKVLVVCGRRRQKPMLKGA